MVNKIKRVLKAVKREEKLIATEAKSIINENNERVIYILKYFHKWLSDNSDFVTITFNILHESHVISYDDFRKGFHDLKIDLSTVELEILILLLDSKNSQEINVEEIVKSIDDLIKLYTPTRDRITLTIFSETVLPIRELDMPEIDFQRFYKVELTNTQFLQLSMHPWHFNFLATEYTTIEQIRFQIERHIDMKVVSIQVMYGSNCRIATELNYSKCLKDYFHEPGSLTYPKTVHFFYDFTIGYVDCPLVLLDSYLRKP